MDPLLFYFLQIISNTSYHIIHSNQSYTKHNFFHNRKYEELFNFLHGFENFKFLLCESKLINFDGIEESYEFYSPIALL